MSQLPKEMRDAIDDIMERKFYFKNMPEHRDRIENSLNEISEAAAIHYSQIIEEKDKQYANLKQCAHDYAEQGRREMERVDKLLKEIEWMKAENERLKMDLRADVLWKKIHGHLETISKLESQIKGLVVLLEKAFLKAEEPLATQIHDFLKSNYYNSIK